MIYQREGNLESADFQYFSAKGDEHGGLGELMDEFAQLVRKNELDSALRAYDRALSRRLTKIARGRVLQWKAPILFTSSKWSGMKGREHRKGSGRPDDAHARRTKEAPESYDSEASFPSSRSILPGWTPHPETLSA